jgi:hypothetical protein
VSNVEPHPAGTASWRRLLGLVLAPAVIDIPWTAYDVSRDNMEAGKPFGVVVAEAFLRSAPFVYVLVGAAALIVFVVVKLRPRLESAWGLMALYPAVCALLVGTGAAVVGVGDQRWRDVIAVALFAAVINLPVALAYCLIAGVPWRRPTPG